MPRSGRSARTPPAAFHSRRSANRRPRSGELGSTSASTMASSADAIRAGSSAGSWPASSSPSTRKYTLQVAQKPSRFATRPRIASNSGVAESGVGSAPSATRPACVAVEIARERHVAPGHRRRERRREARDGARLRAGAAGSVAARPREQGREHEQESAHPPAYHGRPGAGHRQSTGRCPGRERARSFWASGGRTATAAS